MTIKTFTASILCSLSLVLSPSLSADDAQDKGLAIAKEMKSRDRGWVDSSADMEMVLRSRGGRENRREMRILSLEVQNDGDKSMTIFDSPNDVKGTAFLSFTHNNADDDQWLYLPALKRVKRIASKNKSGPFMGSEFAFEDMADQEVDKFKHQWIAEQNCPGGGRCHVIDRFPTSKSGYSRQRIWLDTAHLRLQQVHFFDRRGAHLKTLSLSGYRQYNGRFWRSSRMEMVNHLTGARTRLNWKGYKFNQGLQKNAFTVNALRRIR